MNRSATAVVINRRTLNNKSGVYPVRLRITNGLTRNYDAPFLLFRTFSMDQWLGQDDT